MFNQITEKFQNIVRNVRGFGTINDDNIKSTVRDVRKALIDADVNFKVVKSFISKIGKSKVIILHSLLILNLINGLLQKQILKVIL